MTFYAIVTIAHPLVAGFYGNGFF